jgi:putative membrane-bound dehydrogenase-like protein
MRRMALAGVFLPAVLACFASGTEPATPKTHQVQLNGHTFTLPVGFEIELAAGPPLVNRPITADFDEQGRLYVSDSSGSNEKVQDQLAKKPHRILRLEDTKGDGHFDKATVFADKMMFPEGTMWYAGSLYVAAPPSIWKLTDTDGDGVADQRVEWFKGKTLTGCANDLHGPYLGPDGWIYWCKGAFAKQEYQQPGKPPFVTRAAHIFRARPDGSGIEPVMTGGMDNPVDVVFTPGGERIFTTTFFQHPGGGRRDGLVHAIYGGIYGKDHDVIHDPIHKWTSPDLMPVLTHFGPAAPCGLHRYESTAFGEQYKDNLFACQFNLRKLSRHILIPDGATFRTQDEDFLVSDSHDFHPTDVLEDADGSLLVLDTGGWYKLCCPSSQLVKADVLGAIYRIRKAGATKVEDPRGQKIPWAREAPDELCRLLDDKRPVVRRRAIETLAQLGEKPLESLSAALASQKSSIERRRNAVWAACRIDGVLARSLAATGLADKDESVRQAAIHAVSVWRDDSGFVALCDLLGSGSLHNRRAAAEALGRSSDRHLAAEIAGALINALHKNPDRTLEHSLTYALIELDAGWLLSSERDSDLRARRAHLLVRDQTPSGKLTAQEVTTYLSSSNHELRAAAIWIVGHHPEWGSELAEYYGKCLTADLDAVHREQLAAELTRLASGGAVQELLANSVGAWQRFPAGARVALMAMARAGLKRTPKRWYAEIARAMDSGNVDVMRDAVAAARALPTAKSLPPSFTEALLRVGQDAKQPEAVRLAALATPPPGKLRLDAELFRFVLSRLDREQSLAVRSAAADVVTRASLTAEQLVELVRIVPTVGPIELSKLLEAFERNNDEKVGFALLTALNAPAVRASLRTDLVKPKLEKFGPMVQKEAAKLYAALDAAVADQAAKLEHMLPLVKEGDIRRGQTVFNSTKAACASCHKIGYVGGSIGPDLTRIGQIRIERDLLESIVFPSASFVRSYEPFTATTKAGKVYNGILKKDAADEIVLTLNATDEVRLARDEIEDLQPSKVSIMPAGLDQQLTPRELADLVAFLRACK